MRPMDRIGGRILTFIWRGMLALAHPPLGFQNTTFSNICVNCHPTVSCSVLRTIIFRRPLRTGLLNRGGIGHKVYHLVDRSDFAGVDQGFDPRDPRSLAVRARLVEMGGRQARER